MSKKGKTIEGVLFVTKSGKGFLAHEQYEEDVMIHNQDLGTALNGDEVRVEITHTKKDRLHGKVIKVLSRARETFVGTLEEIEDSLVLRADDQRMYAKMRIKKDGAGEARAGDKVLAKLMRWKDANIDPVGEIVQVLGKSGEHETEMQAVLVGKGFAENFDPQIEKEAQAIHKRGITDNDKKDRRDFRDVTTFTIDPADAKDFDDALSIQTLENGNVEVGIHIADVTHYVTPGTAIDKEARQRATSVYLVDRVIPMLPEVLSNNLCSLVPNEDRLTFSAVFTLNSKSEVIGAWFGRSVIHSNKRFAYKEAQDSIDSKNGPFQQELTQLMEMSRALRKGREKNGAISFETDEVQFELDENGKPIRVFVKERLETMKMIEEFMLLANRKVAEWIENHCKDKNGHDRTFIYRIHDAPDVDRLEELRIFLKAIGHDLGGNKEVNQISSKDIDSLLREVRGTPEEQVVNMATLRSMAKATYTHKNIGHFSLGFGHYTHFTSPIRRYPDMIAHRILASHLDGPAISKDELQAYQKAAITSSEREVAAVEAERDSTKYKQVEFMQDKVGQEFDAVITGVTEHGIYVAEKESRAEGLVHVSNMGNDFFELDKKKYAIVGEKTNKTYRLGDAIRVKLTGANLEQKQLDWELV